MTAVGEDQDDWKSRAMQAVVANFAPSEDAGPLAATDRCVVCQDDVTDPSETTPCLHRQGCWECILQVMHTFGRCAYCRQPMHSLVRLSTRETVYNQGSHPTKYEPPIYDDDDVYGSEQEERPRPRRPRRRNPRVRDDEDGSSRALRRAVARRRSVYTHARFSQHIGSNRHSGYREITPALVLREPALVSRARMWLRRELLVFSFLHPDTAKHRPSPPPAPSEQPGRGRRRGRMAARLRSQNAEFLLEYVVAILKTVDLMGSAGQAENMVAEYLGRDTARLFLHELRAWLRSPYTSLDEWDRAVQYEEEVRPAWLASPDA